MKIKELYSELVEAYSNENLNQITGKLILLYKNKNYSKIREISNKISKYVPIDEEKDAKCFSRLIMLYHPDRGEQIRKTIQTFYENGDIDNLSKHSHILLISDMDFIPVTTVDVDVDYTPEYAWDGKQNDGFSYRDSDLDIEPEARGENEPFSNNYEKSFYNTIKIRVYGNIETEFPSYYLEDYEEFELAFSGLELLDGVEYCTHVKVLDISNNEVSDLSNLWDLKNLEELYIANNKIGYIDSLSNLLKLRVLDISGNQIDDISPIFNLEKLEYVNLIGNQLSEMQINQLKDKGVLVMVD
jgi:Leucine-rich repeat (LRR) protein